MKQKRLSVLVVGRRPACVELLRDVLDEEGCRAVCTSNLSESLLAVERDFLSLVIIDAADPEKDGFEICRLLRQDRRLHDVPALFLSKEDDQALPLEEWGVGSVDFVREPLQRPELLARIRGLLRLHAMSGSEPSLFTAIRDPRLDRTFRETQRLEGLGRLARGVAHDFNNILGAIMGLASGLLTELPADHLAREDLLRIITACRRGHGLARNLLAFAREGARGNNPIEINQTVTELRQLLERTGPKKVAFETRLHPRALYVRGDASQLNQALLNVSLNALEAMPEGGTLTLTTSLVEIDPAAAEADPPLRRGRFVLISTSDTGRGMTEEVCEMAFEPFFTTKPPGAGAGLGLSMVFGTVRAMRGAIALDSKVGEGTTARLYLPAEEIQPLPVSDSPAPRLLELSGQGRTVLLVDDDDLFRLACERLLRRLGYRVMVAANGAEALEVFERHRDTVDLVILDLIMPVMDGVDAFARLKALEPDLPILLCSGYSREERTRELLALGAIGFVQKPFDIQQLADAVEATFDRRAAWQCSR